MNKIKILVVSLILMVGLFSLMPVKVTKAKETQEITNIEVVHFDGEIPAEIKKPVEKGKNLFKYFMQAIGWFAAALGFVFLGIAFFGHQPDQKINALISFAVAILMIIGPMVIDWLIS